MVEDIQPISSARVSATEVARHSFGTVRRGFDPQEVRTYLEQVAKDLAAWEQQTQELRRQVAEAEDRARNPVIDESTLTGALGQQSAQVLRNAHEEAAKIALQAEEAAATLLREAHTHASELRVQAEAGAAERIAEAEIAVGAIHQQAQQEVGLLLESSRAEGDAVIARAREHGQAMVDQAQETRHRILTDMAQRRRAMTLQIEQFRAARDELAASVLGLRESVDRVLGELADADDRARAAAAEVARRQPAQPGEEEMLAGEALTATGLDSDAVAAPRDGAEAYGSEAGEDGAGPAFEAPRTEVPGAGSRAPDELAADVPVEPVSAGTASPGPPGRAADAVEGLFARLRAGQSGEPTSLAEQDDSVASEIEVTAGSGHAIVPESSEEGAMQEDDGPGAPSPAPEDPASVRRAELLDPIVAQLSRRMKRALHDDQNRLLDRVRSSSGSWSGETLLSEPDQRAFYAGAALGGLREAVMAGVTFVRESESGARRKAQVPDDAVATAVADSMASTVVALIRRRLGELEVTIRPEVGADRIGAAYREWRGVRVERLVGDFALEAFSAGIVAAADRASGLRWKVGGAAPACPDCDDNALAGMVGPGESFPTGHRYPPAHPGCRCLVVPTPA